MGISRNTVRSAIRREQPPQYKRSDQINESIRPFVDFIQEAIWVKELRGSRVLADIRSKGYGGSQSAFYRYLKKLRQARGQASYKPYETQPGEQAQFDWSPYTIQLGDELVKIFIHCYLLGYSRYRCYWVSMSDKQGAVFEAMEESLQDMGGVCQRQQTDNASCFVTNASKHNFAWNKNYLALCGHYGIQPTRSLPRRPWSKGKVENPFDYLEDHFIKHRRYDDFVDLVAKLKDFQDDVNNKIHSTTGSKPYDLFQIEKQHLAPLPANRYIGIEEELRKVSYDCLISYGGSKYSVPHFFVGKQVWIRISQGRYIHIHSSRGKILAKHEVSLQKGKVIMQDQHYKNHQAQRGNWQRLAQCFAEFFPEHSAFTDNLKIQKRIDPAYHLTRIMELTKYYDKALFEAAFGAAHRANCYSYHFIQALVQHGDIATPSTPDELKPTSKHMPELGNVDLVRDPAQYNQCITNHTNTDDYDNK